MFLTFPWIEILYDPIISNLLSKGITVSPCFYCCIVLAGGQVLKNVRSGALPHPERHPLILTTYSIQKPVQCLPFQESPWSGVFKYLRADQHNVTVEIRGNGNSFTQWVCYSGVIENLDSGEQQNIKLINSESEVN